MERQILWSPWIGPGLEHLHLSQRGGSIVANSLLIGMQERVPFRLHYEIHCDLQWRLHTVRLAIPGNPSSSLHFLKDENGFWTDYDGKELSSLKGCLDVDISATPFTNTLPIRRLALQPGSSATLSMAYIQIPQMQVKVTQQRYSCLEMTPSGGHYLFESLKDGTSNFSAELPVDQDGLVGDYPGLFRRIMGDIFSSNRE